MLARLSSKTLLLPAALAVGVILILILWPFESGDDVSPDGLGPRGTPNADLAFAICVQVVRLAEDNAWQVVDAGVSQEARRRVESALAIAQRAPEWDPWQPVEGVQVDEGCPTLPSLRHEGGQWLDLGKLVEEPGFYDAYIFVVPDENLERLPFGLDPRRADQEHTCSGDDCRSEAFAVFFAQSQMSDEGYVADMFMYAAGVRDLQARQD